MMANSSEQSLECNTKSYSMLNKSFGDHNNPQDEATQKLEEYLNRLEEERLKIDAFKRELPLCMQLLINAMETSRQQLQIYKGNQGTKPILEEFIPLKNCNNIEGSNQKPANISDKANWMTSAQLWSQTSDGKPQQITSNLPKNEDHHHHNNNNNNHINLNNMMSPNNLCIETKQRNGGAFIPFWKERSLTPKSMRVLPELLALASSPSEEDKKNNESENAHGSMSSDNSSRGGGGMFSGNKANDGQANTTTNTTNNNSNNQGQRKARRCWSPDLHRRFVNALQMLGGSQVATPKQIRELMKVDGLTNDEVKSHLQKYRLHTRRPSPSPQTSGAQTPQLVVLGGIWVPPEYANAAGGGPTMYTTHPATSQMSPHYCSTVMTQDFYSSPPPLPPPSQPQLHHPSIQYQQQQQQLHVYKTSSHTQTHSSPESDAQGAGDRSESIEDGKSESSSLIAESYVT